MGKWKSKDWISSCMLSVISVMVFLFLIPWMVCCMGDEIQRRPITIVELQPFRESSSIEIPAEGSREGHATLINLNPNINAWYHLQLQLPGPQMKEEYHLENANSLTQVVRLDKSNPNGLILTKAEKRSPCDLLDSHRRVEEGRRSHVPYVPLCDTRLYIRNPVKGHQTPVETVTDFLRKEVPGGEEIVSLVRDNVFARLYDEKAEQSAKSSPAESPLERRGSDDGPAPALLDPRQAVRTLKPIDLGIQTHESVQDGMIAGTWYCVEDNPGIYVSVIVPSCIAPELMNSYPSSVHHLDSVESGQAVYLVAFDLSRFDLHYALGTVHPLVGWSKHIPDQMREKSLPGPDGIGTIAPLVSTGTINPMDAPRTVAAFTGGYKREHGAFAHGPLSLKNHGSHYGFLENGVIFSTLQPGLSTIYVLNDGWADMKTWGEEDNTFLSKIRYARQNGAPLIDGSDPASGLSIPGPWVGDWAKGNWSGSAERSLRTMRAGASLQEFKGKRFLIYAFFWSATPSAMARVFQAYQCRYAMLLDMNALVHTYLAVYRQGGSNISVQHLIKGMSEADTTVEGRHIPRFLGYPDDRDFFYLTKKEAP